jgi:hypothetical protein
MELTTALLGYLAIIVLLFLIFIRIGITIISSIVLSLIFGQVALNFLAPPGQINPWDESSSTAASYYLIQIGTPLFIAVYILIISFKDRRKERVCTRY